MARSFCFQKLTGTASLAGMGQVPHRPCSQPIMLLA